MTKREKDIGEQFVNPVTPEAWDNMGGGINVFGMLLSYALSGALATGTTPVIAARVAAEAAREALKHLAEFSLEKAQ